MYFEYDQLKMTSLTLSMTNYNYNNTKVPNFKMLLNLLLNSAVRLHRSPRPACLARTGWDTCTASLAPLALLALKVLLNDTRKVKSLRVKVKSCKEAGHFKKCGQSSYKASPISYKVP